jgi:uncharacterized OB-fold protein
VVEKVQQKKCGRKIVAEKVRQKKCGRKSAAEKVRKKNRGRRTMETESWTAESQSRNRQQNHGNNKIMTTYGIWFMESMVYF